MSKESFSLKLTEDIIKRFKAIDRLELDTLLENNDTFLLALAISYMTLSKEKIIKKDYNNKDRTDINRLTRRVPTQDIDLLFDGENQPNIIYTDVEDNTWILDNIRDSILHEHFDILEEERLLVIDNTMYGKRLKAEIPFDWFFDYINTNILNKRFTDKYTNRGFFFNPDYSNLHPDIKGYIPKQLKRDIRYFAVQNHIIYKVDIEGNKLPIQELDEKIYSTFLRIAIEEVTDEDIQKYAPKIPKELYSYPIKYSVSFLKAKDEVEEQLKKDYPDSKIRIRIEQRKRKLVNKFRQKYFNTTYDYYDLFRNLNTLFKKRSKAELDALPNLFNYINNEGNLKHFDKNILIRIVYGEKYRESKNNLSFVGDMISAKDIICDTLFQVYGLTILAINKSALNNEESLKSISNVATGYNLDTYTKYANKRRKLINDILRLKIEIAKYQDNLEKCPEDKKEYMQEVINKLEAKLKVVEEEKQILLNTRYLYSKRREERNQADEACAKLISIINTYLDNFESCKYSDKKNGVPSKKIIKEIILDLLDKLTEIESKYYFALSDPKETLEMIRNCFSHIGRVKSNNLNRLCFYDFDNEGEYSGLVEADPISFIYFLSDCINNKDNYNNQDNKIEEAKTL